MKKRALLLVDDDVQLRDTLRDQLELYDEFSISICDSGCSAIEFVKINSVEMILLDVGLQDIDGREVCKIMRKNGFPGSILMLTGHTSDSDTILGLESGANDYITKPFKFSVLLARIRAHLRTYDNSEEAVFSIGNYQFKPSARLLNTKDGKSIRLTDKESGILKYMLKFPERPVSREELLKDVWGYHAEASTHTLETHIYRLRQKIESKNEQIPLLMTVEGGYKLKD